MPSVGNTCYFQTLPGQESDKTIRFAVITGMNYSKFHYGTNNKPETAYHGQDKHLGYPALETIRKKNPDFIVFTGDNVYYDSPADSVSRAKTQEEMRRKWHEQFVQPRFIKLFAEIPAYWEKDDHDHRYNDCDTLPGKDPSNLLGINTFKEQVPVTDPKNNKVVTYRTQRINKHLQIWLTEGRDYRSPNNIPDGPDKSLWGRKQLSWLKETLL